MANLSDHDASKDEKGVHSQKKEKAEKIRHMPLGPSITAPATAAPPQQPVTVTTTEVVEDEESENDDPTGKCWMQGLQNYRHNLKMTIPLPILAENYDNDNHNDNDNDNNT